MFWLEGWRVEVVGKLLSSDVDDDCVEDDVWDVDDCEDDEFIMIIIIRNNKCYINENNRNNNNS